jgi:hypothetical protein
MDSTYKKTKNVFVCKNSEWKHIFRTNLLETSPRIVCLVLRQSIR